MAEQNSLESLQALYTDILALSESRLSSLERLGAQLDAHIQDFRALLDKKTRNEQSRQSLATGKLDIAGDRYEVNDEFQQGAFKLADELNLDELDAARIFLEVQDETDSSGHSALTNSILRFHQRRRCLLDCLRLLLQLSSDVDQDEDLREELQVLVGRIIQPSSGPVVFARRCLSSMRDIKIWLQGLVDKMNSASVLGQGQQPELLEIMEYQRTSLVTQHESLGVILLYLVKENHSVVADFEQLIEVLRTAARYDSTLVHYIPALLAYISRFGGAEGGSLADAKALNDKIFRQVDEKPWALNYVYAAVRAWWLAEYSGWFGENHDGSMPDNQLEDEIKLHSRRFSESLKDGAFDFMLSVSADVKPVEWQDPARQGLREWLQQRAPFIVAETARFSIIFREVLMEQLQGFIEAFIINLPDVLRKLRVDEDEQRQLSQEYQHELDLERFMVIVAYAFDGRPKAAMEAFWDTPDCALVGFLVWASKRASTPLISTFCEMLLSISEDDDCATATHGFLLDEGPQSSGKMRRTHSLTWNQLFKEISFFCGKLRDAPTLSQPQMLRPGKPNDLAEKEPESTAMLEQYMRLITRLCSQSETVRTFLAQNTTFALSETLFQLVSTDIQSRLRASAFTTLRSLLTKKTKTTSDYMWVALDLWITGGYSPGSGMPKSSVMTSSIAHEHILERLASGFEEPHAFVQFIHALVLPYSGESGLHDDLPFPEGLGASSRQPGIDVYVDFVVGRIFRSHIEEISDTVQRSLLQLSCLDFIGTCLNTFNEDLVIFASQSNIAVDSAIRASNLTNYVLLHPFSRVMEWLFDDKVMAALFVAIHHDPEDVGRAAPDSTLILCLTLGINVAISIMDLQSTYLDIIRPLIKSQSHPRLPYINASFGSFEEGVLNHLTTIPDLGRYCGSGHPELTIGSLRLLEKLSASPKLASPLRRGRGMGPDRNKIIAALADDAETISKILIQEMQSDIDINLGPQSSTYSIKLHILDFLIACLRAHPSQPTIAHLLLGFECHYEGVSVDSEGPFGRGTSLFHTILGEALSSSITDDGVASSWLVTLSSKALQVQRELWTSPMSSSITLMEMRTHETFFVMFVREIVVQPGMAWDGLTIDNPAFISSTAASCLAEFMSRRALLLQYLSAELRLVMRGHSPSLKQRMLNTLLGSTTIESGQKLDNATVFDLFDFMEPGFNRISQPPQLTWFSDVDLNACLEVPGEASSIHDLVKMEELLVLRRTELTESKRLEDPQELLVVNSQAQDLLEFYALDNQIIKLSASRLQVLKAWVQLTLVMMDTGEADSSAKTSFILRALQTIMPILEADVEAVEEAMELARLAKTLVFSLDFDSASFKQGDMGNLVSDQFFHLFQVSLRAISTLGSRVALKEYYYNICYRYLAGVSDIAGTSGVHVRHSMQTIRSAGERFIDLICDDAYSGEATCRIAALLVLGELVKMGEHENSKYVIESLGRLNFVSILVESIRDIPADLRNTAVEDVHMQLSYCHAKLALLLNISQTRFGAAVVLNAGLLHAVKISGLFVTDPDLGVDIEGPGAMDKHYDLLAAIMRVICGALLSRGTQNQQTLEQGRKFLAENKLSILAVLKKSAGLGNAATVSEHSIGELADAYMLLISVSGFLDFEDQTTRNKQSPKGFAVFT